MEPSVGMANSVKFKFLHNISHKLMLWHMLLVRNVSAKVT